MSISPLFTHYYILYIYYNIYISVGISTSMPKSLIKLSENSDGHESQKSGHESQKNGHEKFFHVHSRLFFDDFCQK